MTEQDRPARAYTMSEVDQIRRYVTSIWSLDHNGVSYREEERILEIEQRTRTYLAAGVSPEDIEAQAQARHEIFFKHREHMAEVHSRLQDGWREAEKERKGKREEQYGHLSPKQRVLRDWYDECVAKYDGAAEKARDLYDGYMGRTLCKFVNQRAPDGVNISQVEMERFLDTNGHRKRRVQWDTTYDGIAVIIHGSLHGGNWTT